MQSEIDELRRIVANGAYRWQRSVSSCVESSGNAPLCRSYRLSSREAVEDMHRGCEHALHAADNPLQLRVGGRIYPYLVVASVCGENYVLRSRKSAAIVFGIVASHAQKAKRPHLSNELVQFKKEYDDLDRRRTHDELGVLLLYHESGSATASRRYFELRVVGGKRGETTIYNMGVRVLTSDTTETVQDANQCVVPHCLMRIVRDSRLACMKSMIDNFSTVDADAVLIEATPLPDRDGSGARRDLVPCMRCLTYEKTLAALKEARARQQSEYEQELADSIRELREAHDEKLSECKSALLISENVCVERNEEATRSRNEVCVLENEMRDVEQTVCRLEGQNRSLQADKNAAELCGIEIAAEATAATFTGTSKRRKKHSVKQAHTAALASTPHATSHPKRVETFEAETQTEESDKIDEEAEERTIRERICNSARRDAERTPLFAATASSLLAELVESDEVIAALNDRIARAERDAQVAQAALRDNERLLKEKIADLTSTGKALEAQKMAIKEKDKLLADQSLALQEKGSDSRATASSSRAIHSPTRCSQTEDECARKPVKDQAHIYAPPSLPSLLVASDDQRSVVSATTPPQSSTADNSDPLASPRKASESRSCRSNPKPESTAAIRRHHLTAHSSHTSSVFAATHSYQTSSVPSAGASELGSPVDTRDAYGFTPSFEPHFGFGAHCAHPQCSCSGASSSYVASSPLATYRLPACSFPSDSHHMFDSQNGYHPQATPCHAYPALLPVHHHVGPFDERRRQFRCDQFAHSWGGGFAGFASAPYETHPLEWRESESATGWAGQQTCEFASCSDVHSATTPSEHWANLRRDATDARHRGKKTSPASKDNEQGRHRRSQHARRNGASPETRSTSAPPDDKNGSVDAASGCDGSQPDGGDQDGTVREEEDKVRSEIRKILLGGSEVTIDEAERLLCRLTESCRRRKWK